MIEPTPKQQNWIVAGAATFMVFLAGIFLKELDDISTLSQREADHSVTDEREFTLLQAEIDRRLAAEDVSQRTQDQAVDANRDTIAKNNLIIAGNTERITSLQRDLEGIKSEIERLNKQYMEVAELSGKRMEDIGVRITEVQRQISGIEGKLGYSVPERPHGAP